MQTSYSVNQDIAVEGQPVGDRESRPMELAWLPQINTITIASAEAGDLVITITDDETSQVYSLTVAISGAVEATSLDEMLAAWQANAKFNDLFSVAEDGATVFTPIARHANRAYTIATTPPGSMTAVVAETQASGGSGVEFGRFVIKGSEDNSYDGVGAATVIADLAGMLFRTDANHFHSLENDTPAAVDASERGKTYAILERGRVMVKVEEAVTPASTPYMRRAQTSGAGRVGGLRASAVGGQASYTVTPTVNHKNYAFEYGYLGQNYVVQYSATDETTAVADAIDGLYDAAGGASPPTGITLAETATELTVQTAAGTDLDYIRCSAWGLDTEAISCTVATSVAADVDAIDVSSICEFETSAGADGYSRLRLKKTA